MKNVLFYTFYNETIRTYRYITANKKMLFVKKYLSLLWILTEHKHCDKAATNSNSENARNRMVASLRGSVCTWTEEVETSTGRLWAAEFHHVTALSGLARVLKLMNCLFL